MCYYSGFWPRHSSNSSCNSGALFRMLLRRGIAGAALVIALWTVLLAARRLLPKTCAHAERDVGWTRCAALPSRRPARPGACAPAISTACAGAPPPHYTRPVIGARRYERSCETCSARALTRDDGRLSCAAGSKLAWYCVGSSGQE